MYPYRQVCNCKPDVKYWNDEEQSPCHEFYQGIPGIYVLNKGVPVEFVSLTKMKEFQGEKV